MGRGRLLAAVGVCALLASVPTATSAYAGVQHPAAADLRVTSLSAPSATLPHAATVAVRVTNDGNRSAKASRTVVYLAKTTPHGQQDIDIGKLDFPTLAVGKHATHRVALHVPTGTKPGVYRLIACADASHSVSESSESNNCRTATKHVTLACTTGDHDCDGYLPPADCNDHNASIHPGASDVPDLTFVDSNCDGIDGDAAHAVFVSGLGDDTNAGTRTKPVKTLFMGMEKARAAHEAVYVSLGEYDELLVVENGVSVYGGYDAAWHRALTNVTRITGGTPSDDDTQAAIAYNVTDVTTLQLLTLQPAAPIDSGTNSYGLRGNNSGGLRLDHLTITAAAGVAGGNGINGVKGQNGGNGGNVSDNAFAGFGLAGTSPVGHRGGNGGAGGVATSGADGSPGLALSADAWGRAGGPGGPGGDGGPSPDTAGGTGYAGDSGTFLGDGAGGTTSNHSGTPGRWLTAPGVNGPAGTSGHGGGGGGGGGGESGDENYGGGGGGGGGGGQGGGGGGGGQGGGGSFGIFLVQSVGATVTNSTVTASAGGGGGIGGVGAAGGTGGTAGQGSEGSGSRASSGADGGVGGSGASGGDAGGGAGGPSIAIFGIPPADAPGTTTAHGIAGSGGAGGRHDAPGRGADGIAADFAG